LLSFHCIDGSSDYNNNGSPTKKHKSESRNSNANSGGDLELGDQLTFSDNNGAPDLLDEILNGEK